MKFFEYSIVYYGSGDAAYWLKKSGGIYSQYDYAEDDMKEEIEEMKADGWKIQGSEIREVEIIR